MAEKAQLNSGKDLLCFEQHKRACDCQGLYERRRWTDVQLLTPPADAQPNSAKRKREEAELNSEKHKRACLWTDVQLLTTPALPAGKAPAQDLRQR